MNTAMKNKSPKKSATNKKPSLFASAMMDLLSHSETDKPENGYKTTKEWSEYIGIPIPTMFKRLQDLQRLGKIKTKTYRVKASVTIRKIQHYRIDPEWLKLHGL
jgi:hypothetical protein